MRGVRTYVVHMRVIFLHVYVIRNAAKMVMCSLSQKQPTQQKSNIAIVSGLKTINSAAMTAKSFRKRCACYNPWWTARLDRAVSEDSKA